MTIDTVVDEGNNAGVGSTTKTRERFRPNDPYWSAMTHVVESCLEPNFDELKQLMKYSKTKLSPALVQEAYQLYVTEGKFDCLDTLKGMTGVEPVFDPEFIHAQYKKLIDVNSLGGLKRLRELTKVQPDVNLVQNKYHEYCQNLRRGKYNNVCWFSILEKCTGIKPSPEIDREVLDLIYGRQGKKD